MRSLIADSVMSARGVLRLFCADCGSGDTVGFGVGNVGVAISVAIASGVIETLLLRLGRAGACILRFVGEAFFVGEVASALGVAGMSKTEASSGASLMRVRLVFVAVRGVVGTSLAFRRDTLFALCGAGVKSSSSSLFVMRDAPASSWSEDSTTTARTAARLDGRAAAVPGMLTVAERCQPAVARIDLRLDDGELFVY